MCGDSCMAQSFKPLWDSYRVCQTAKYLHCATSVCLNVTLVMLLFIPSRLAGASVGIFSASRQCSHCISRDKTWGGIRFQDLSARGSGCCTVKDYYIKDNMKCLLKEIQRSLVCFLIVGNFHISSAAMTAPTIKWP